MKVFDLQCSQQHRFEGWFGSENDFADQLQRGLLLCPVCSDGAISKLLSAPRLNLNRSQGESPSVPPSLGSAAHESRMQADWLAATRQLIENTEDVGTQFPDEARKMHYGELEPRAIRGEASHDETRALLEEGIPVLPLMVPESLKKPLQ